MKRAAVIIYGTLSYIFFAITLLYFVGFVIGIGVPKTVDTGGGQTRFLEALLTNCVLIGLFGLQHSVMARQGFKDWWTKLIPPPVERSTYVLFASVMLGLLIWYWQPMPTLVWNVEHLAGRVLIYALFLFGVAMFLISTCLIDHFELFGLKQVYAYFSNQKPSSPVYRTPFLYKLMRHPLILGLIIVFWSTPRMTVGHLVLAAGMTAYCFIGVSYEERDLVSKFGDSYRKYQRSTPMLLPTLSRKREPPRNQSADRYA